MPEWALNAMDRGQFFKEALEKISTLESAIAKQDSDSELLNAFDVKIMSSLGETYKHRDDICDLIERKDIPIRELIRQVELLDWIKNTTTGT